MPGSLMPWSLMRTPRTGGDNHVLTEGETV